MHNEQHDLAHEFPEYRERIHALKESDSHFRRLFDEYHELDRQAHRAGTDVEPLSDDHAEAIKLRRLQLKDELYNRLRAG